MPAAEGPLTWGKVDRRERDPYFTQGAFSTLEALRQEALAVLPTLSQKTTAQHLLINLGALSPQAWSEYEELMALLPEWQEVQERWEPYRWRTRDSRPNQMLDAHYLSREHLLLLTAVGAEGDARGLHSLTEPYLAKSVASLTAPGLPLTMAYLTGHVALEELLSQELPSHHPAALNDFQELVDFDYTPFPSYYYWSIYLSPRSMGYRDMPQRWSEPLILNHLAETLGYHLTPASEEEAASNRRLFKVKEEMRTLFFSHPRPTHPQAPF